MISDETLERLDEIATTASTVEHDPGGWAQECAQALPLLLGEVRYLRGRLDTAWTKHDTDGAQIVSIFTDLLEARAALREIERLCESYRGGEPVYVPATRILAIMDKTRGCVCNVGVRECPVHPGRLMTKEEKIEFRKRWDDRVVQNDD